MNSGKTGDFESPVFRDASGNDPVIIRNESGKKGTEMERRGLQQTWVRILLTVLTIAVMFLIFFFSTEPAERSDETSGIFARKVIGILHPDYDNYPPARQKEIYDGIQYTVRKIAHFTEYTVFGLLLRLCLESWFGKRSWIFPVSLSSGAFYACTDELHQLLTDGRCGEWKDILLDSFGVLAGILAAMLILRRVRKKNVRKG